MKNIVAIFFLAFIFSCQKHDLNVESDKPKNESGNVFTVKYYGQDIQVVKKENEYYWFDDVVFNQKTFDSLKALKEKSPSTEPRSAVNNAPNNNWPNGVVYYTINSAFDAYQSEKNIIIAAINHWQSNTTVRFIQRTNQPNYIGFERVLNQNYSGASEGIGKKGGYQYIKLDAADPFDLKTVIHEIGHAIGLYHEQSRADRDNFIELYTQNMIDSYQFQTYVQRNQPGVDVGTFDWNSVMLYDSYSGSSNGNATMLRKSDLQPFYTYFNTSLSQGDLEGIAFIYGPPYARLELENVIYESVTGSDYYDEYIVDNVFIRLYSDAACTIPFITPVDKFIHTYFRGSIGGYSNVTIAVPAGQSGVLVHYNLETRAYHSDYGMTTVDRWNSYGPLLDGFAR